MLLTVPALMDRTGWSESTARRQCALWFDVWNRYALALRRGEAPLRPAEPRTVKLRTGRRGRPPYAVGLVGFEQWLFATADEAVAA